MMKLKQSPEAFDFTYLVAVEKKKEMLESYDDMMSKHLGTCWTDDAIREFLERDGKSSEKSDNFVVPLLLALTPQNLIETFKQKIGHSTENKLGEKNGKN